MELLTADLLNEFQQQGDTSMKEEPDIKVIAKYFYAFGAMKWFATEYDAENRIFFGYANLGDDQCAELGYFSLDELESVPFIERDLYFGHHTLQG